MIAELLHMPLDEAYLCLDCNAVGNCGTECAACKSSHVFAIQKWLDRKTKGRKR